MPFNQYGVFYRDPWHIDKDFAKKLKESGRGPKFWHRDYDMGIVRLGDRVFELHNLKPFKLPEFDNTQKKRLEIISNLTSGIRAQIRAKKLDQYILANPDKMKRKELERFRGSWIDINDLKIADRLVEFLGIISSNKGISKRQLQVFYNTSAYNIQRMIILATAFGVTFTSASCFRIKSYGIFNENAINAIYLETKGLKSVMEEIIACVDGVKSNGMVGYTKANMLAYEYWKNKEANK